MINEKDRGQLLRMAGNIACGLATRADQVQMYLVPELSAQLAFETLKEVDKLIAEQATKEG